MPVRDEVAKIGECVEGILGQTIRVSEIIVVDSGSTDGTLEVLSRFPTVRVISLDPSKFNHGEARNLGVRAAVTDWVVLTVGDARAYSNTWLEKLFEGVIDQAVIAVCGSQVVPHSPMANPVNWFRPQTEPRLRRLQFASERDFDALTPLERKEACGWDDVNALYRRDILLQFPFEPLMYAEDAIWAMTVLRKGHAIVYNPAARVYHYHTETPQFTYKRTLLTLCYRYQNFGFVHDRPHFGRQMMRTAVQLIREWDLGLVQRIKWLRYNWENQSAMHSAFQEFESSLAAGETAVQRLCAKCSSTAPVPIKVAPVRDARQEKG
jgi:rhamnosyltransferase